MNDLQYALLLIVSLLVLAVLIKICNIGVEIIKQRSCNQNINSVLESISLLEVKIKKISDYEKSKSKKSG